MPNAPKSQHRSVRFSDEDWADLQAATAAVGSDRGTVLKEFTAWYLHRPGAQPVKRPDRDAWATGADAPAPHIEAPATANPDRSRVE